MKKRSLRVIGETPLAINLAALMERYQVTELQLARALNTSVMTIRRLVLGETPDPRVSTLSLIANYFNVSIDALLQRDSRVPIHIESRRLPQYIPVLNWDILKMVEEVSKMDLTTWTEWYPVVPEYQTFLNENAFAIRSRASMMSWCPLGSLLIMGPCNGLKDGDLVLVRMKNGEALSLRQLVMDVPNWVLKPLIEGAPVLLFDDTILTLLGVLVFTVYHARPPDGISELINSA